MKDYCLMNKFILQFIELIYGIYLDFVKLVRYFIKLLFNFFFFFGIVEVFIFEDELCFVVMLCFVQLFLVRRNDWKVGFV